MPQQNKRKAEEDAAADADADASNFLEDAQRLRGLPLLVGGRAAGRRRHCHAHQDHASCQTRCVWLNRMDEEGLLEDSLGIVRTGTMDG